MGKLKIDRAQVKKLHDEGRGVVEIADKMTVSKGAISKILKELGIYVTRAAVKVAPEYVEKKDAASDHLLFLAEKARRELEWIETTVPPRDDGEYRSWQDQKIKFSAEMRKLISSMADIGYKLFQATEVAEALRIIDEEIGNESIECQQKIRERLQRRRDLRFPVEFNRT